MTQYEFGNEQAHFNPPQTLAIGSGSSNLLFTADFQRRAKFLVRHHLDRGHLLFRNSDCQAIVGDVGGADAGDFAVDRADQLVVFWFR